MKKRIIRDFVHGYISVDDDDLKVINHPLFQRLSRIHQGTNRSAYPSATHTRFEHSLGVMHLGTKVINNVIENAPAETKEILKQKEREVRFACLLHDIGHAPLSHIGESFYHKDNLVSEVTSLRGSEVTAEYYKESKPHELMSALIILKQDDIKENLDNLGLDISFIADMICGVYQPYDGSPLSAIVQILYSSIDVDRLDFVLRDNKMAGGDFLNVDTARMLASYTIADNLLQIDYRALSTITNFIYGRSNIYMWVMNHHRNVLVSNLLTEYIKELLKLEKEGWEITFKKQGSLEKYFSYEGISELVDDHDLMVVLKNNKILNHKTHTCFQHIFERGSLSPIWKSGIEFDYFLKKECSTTEADKFKGVVANDHSKGHLVKVEEFLNT